MPLFSRKGSKGADYKARLEHKLYLARENPEPVFDLSDCALKTVPSGIYSLCKVFRKDVLYLQENLLTSLAGGGNMSDLAALQVLDLHSNCLVTLPDDLKYLRSLKVLNVSSNQLKRLPEELGCLEQLQLLNAAENALKSLPEVFGHLHNLEKLDVRGNNNLTRLPSDLGRAQRLSELMVDVETLQHPPTEVTQLGTQAILTFLAAECGVEYETKPWDASCSSSVPLTSLEESEKSFQARLIQLEKLKDQKQQERLALEQQLGEQHNREIQLQDSVRKTKGRLLEELCEQQNRLEGEILRVQQGREVERQKLITQLLQVETAADCVISQLLAASASERDLAQNQILLEHERLEEERLLNIRQEENQELRHREILSAMEELLEEEGRRADILREYEEDRAHTARTLISQEMEESRQLAEVLSHQGKAHSELVVALHQDEQLQRAAVAALLERSDARTWGLVQQVSIIEVQLAALTAAEMERKKLQMGEQEVELKSKREALSTLLVELLAQQAMRRRQLLRTLERMEQRRWGDAKDDEQDGNFWLLQYQRLLDMRSGSLMEMERSLDPALTQHLAVAGVIHCLPLLAQWLGRLEELTDEKLQEVGVSSCETRKALLEAVSLYLEERSWKSGKLLEEARVPSAKPTAPLQLDVETVTIGKTECVVCMEQQCEVIFIPCGHMCCCAKCSERLSECPLCRGNIEQKVRVIVP